VTLEVEDEGRMLTSQQVVLGDDGEPVVTRVRFVADQAGPRRISFRIPTAENEQVAGKQTEQAFPSYYALHRRAAGLGDRHISRAHCRP
jgi:hypothetical protein